MAEWDKQNIIDVISNKSIAQTEDRAESGIQDHVNTIAALETVDKFKAGLIGKYTPLLTHLSIELPVDNSFRWIYRRRERQLPTIPAENV